MPTLVTHVDEPSDDEATSNHKVTASSKEAHGESNLCAKKQVLSPPHLLSFHFLLLSSVIVVVAVTAQQPCGMPTANGKCCKMSQTSEKCSFRDLGTNTQAQSVRKAQTQMDHAP